MLVQSLLTSNHGLSYNNLYYFLLLTLKGSSIGVAITFPFCGFILEKWGWPYVFYITGVIGMVWFLAWWLLVYDTPAQHPYISEVELVHITSSLTNVVSTTKVWTVIFVNNIYTNHLNRDNLNRMIFVFFFFNLTTAYILFFKYRNWKKQHSAYLKTLT